MTDKITYIDDRPCNVNKSKEHPTAFSKFELVELAVEKLDMTMKEAMKYTKNDLCAMLSSKIARASVSVRNEKTCLDRTKVKPLPHQERFVSHICDPDVHGGVMAHDRGSGKTLTMILSAECLIDLYPDIQIIFVIPTTLRDNLIGEMNKMGVDYRDHHFKIYTHDYFAIKYKNHPYPPNSALIIDEAHHFRTAMNFKKVFNKKGEEKTSKSTVALRCAKIAKKVILATGTPAYHQVSDIINLVAMAKGEDPISKAEFYRILEDPVKFKRYVYNIFSIYIPGKEGYPKVIERTVKVVMTPEIYKKYRTIEKRKTAFLDIEDPWVFMTGMRLATLALKPHLKAMAAEKIIEEHGRNKRYVIYSAFKHNGVRLLQRQLRKSKIPFIELTGDVPQNKRGEIVEKYNRGEANILFITDAGAEGLDLKETDYVILLEKGWNRSGQLQVIARAARYHSHKNTNAVVRVLHLVMVKPPVGAREASDTKFGSADEILEATIQKNMKKIIEMMAKIYPYTIDNTKK